MAVYGGGREESERWSAGAAAEGGLVAAAPRESVKRCLPRADGACYVRAATQTLCGVVLGSSASECAVGQALLSSVLYWFQARVAVSALSPWSDVRFLALCLSVATRTRIFVPEETHSKKGAGSFTAVVSHLASVLCFQPMARATL